MPVTTDPTAAGRILIYGGTGSGKSTQQKRTGLLPTVADEPIWKPGWVPVPDDRRRELLAKVDAAARSVPDTAYEIGCHR